MIKLGAPVIFAADKQPNVELHNYWPPEQGFVWSGGRWSETLFAFEDEIDHGKQYELVLELDVYKNPPEFEQQNILVYLNGLRIGSRVVNKRVTVFLDFPGTYLRSADNVLTIDTPDSQRPAAFGGTDKRLLGIQLFSFEIRSIAPV